MPEMDLITAVVRRSRADDTLQAALDAGAPGITYFWARGTGVKEGLGYAGTLIEGEKQVLWVVTNRETTEKVLKAIADAGNLSLPGEGFAYVQTVTRAVGFVPPEKAQ
ncbi:MAG: transcriptional regulator [Elusimicrobia bacterium]|nr:MAG: transcriptional regulator [Elusimicrobiota bacterium]